MGKVFKKDILIGLSVIFGSLFLATGALLWLSKDINDRVGKIIDKRGLINQQAGLAGTIATLKVGKAEADKYLVTLDRLVPQKDDLFTFSKWIDGFSKNYGIGMNFAFAGGETEPTENALGFAPFTLTLSGSLARIQVFLTDLESRADQFLIGIDSYSVRSIGEGGYNVSVAGRIYYGN